MDPLLLILFGVILGSLARAWISLAPWMPTRLSDLEQIHEIIKLKKEAIFLEFGCGTSHVSTYIAKKNPQAHIIGIEYAFPFFLYSRCKQKICGPQNMKIIFGNGFKYPLQNVDVLYTFGMPKTINQQLKQKVLSEMKRGALCVSYVFTIEDWEGGTTTMHKGKSNAGSLYVFEKQSK